jgi:hypothetical protein
MPPRKRDQRPVRGPSGQRRDEQLPWAIIYYRAADGTTPALDFLDRCPGGQLLDVTAQTMPRVSDDTEGLQPALSAVILAMPSRAGADR